MKITHYCNSFINVNVDNTNLVCDPWVGRGANIGWMSYPINTNGIEILNEILPDYIYISHLHPDHFDPEILKFYKNNHTKIIIKNFRDKRLKNRIISLGIEKIIEIDEWEVFSLNEKIEVIIVPQLSSNVEDIEDNINYDLDTSIIIKSKITNDIFYNNVDNPLSIKDFKIIADYVYKKFNKAIDIACVAIGASSEYPHCFLNINKKDEKVNTVNKSLIYAEEALKNLKPKAFFSAGGTYTIYGKYSMLNEYIARPSFKQISNHLKHQDIRIYDLEGGKSVILKNKDISFVDDFSGKRYSSLQESLDDNKNKLYDYQKIQTDTSNVEFFFKRAKENYLKQLEKKEINFDWNVKFCLYENLTIDEDLNISQELQSVKNFDLFSQKKQNNEKSLTCHMDIGLFLLLITKKIPWNLPISGSLILYERNPNIFIPDITFSLNYLCAQ